jgi:hypothetical protein
MPALTVKAHLVVRANGDVRVVKNKPRLRLDEVAFPLTVTVPQQWGRVQATTIDVALPEPPEARVTVGLPEMDD